MAFHTEPTKPPLRFTSGCQRKRSSRQLVLMGNGYCRVYGTFGTLLANGMAGRKCTRIIQFFAALLFLPERLLAQWFSRKRKSGFGSVETCTIYPSSHSPTESFWDGTPSCFCHSTASTGGFTPHWARGLGVPFIVKPTPLYTLIPIGIASSHALFAKICGSSAGSLIDDVV